jgi:hypothetical protein
VSIGWPAAQRDLFCSGGGHRVLPVQPRQSEQVIGPLATRAFDYGGLRAGSSKNSSTADTMGDYASGLSRGGVCGAAGDIRAGSYPEAGPTSDRPGAYGIPRRFILEGPKREHVPHTLRISSPMWCRGWWG